MEIPKNFLIRIISFNYDIEAIASFLEGRCSYVSSYNPFLEIEAPNKECNEVMNFLLEQELEFRIYS